MTRPKLIYVAGAYSAPDRAGVEANIARAVDVGVEVAKLGAMPVIPHANTADARFEQVQGYEFWLAGTLELMHGCDGVIMVPGWETSNGARKELEEATTRQTHPVFLSVESLARWLKSQADLDARTAGAAT